jgi:hypothetical protein
MRGAAMMRRRIMRRRAALEPVIATADGAAERARDGGGAPFGAGELALRSGELALDSGELALDVPGLAPRRDVA